MIRIDAIYTKHIPISFIDKDSSMYRKILLSHNLLSPYGGKLDLGMGLGYTSSPRTEQNTLAQNASSRPQAKNAPHGEMRQVFFETYIQSSQLILRLDEMGG